MNLAWSQTSPHADNTDLWQEEISDDGKRYKVDGEWRDLTIIDTEIKIKGGESVKHQMRLTHRGPVMESDLLHSALRGIFNWPALRL